MYAIEEALKKCKRAKLVKKESNSLPTNPWFDEEYKVA